MTQIIVRDNFLSGEVYSMLYGKYKSTVVKEKVERYFFDYDPTPEISQYLNFFTKKRGYNKLAKFIHTAATPPNFYHKMHDEAEFKIMSAIVYIAPETSHGTTFCMDKRFEIEWKPNRLMIFCGETDVTWHYYKSMDKMRFTYNYFLVDPTKIKNKEYLNYVI
jgi:hypothetical protein